MHHSDLAQRHAEARRLSLRGGLQQNPCAPLVTSPRCRIALQASAFDLLLAPVDLWVLELGHQPENGVEANGPTPLAQPTAPSHRAQSALQNPGCGICFVLFEYR